MGRGRGPSGRVLSWLVGASLSDRVELLRQDHDRIRRGSAFSGPGRSRGRRRRCPARRGERVLGASCSGVSTARHRRVPGRCRRSGASRTARTAGARKVGPVGRGRVRGLGRMAPVDRLGGRGSAMVHSPARHHGPADRSVRSPDRGLDRQPAKRTFGRTASAPTWLGYHLGQSGSIAAEPARALVAHRRTLVTDRNPRSHAFHWHGQTSHRRRGEGYLVASSRVG